MDFEGREKDVRQQITPSIERNASEYYDHGRKRMNIEANNAFRRHKDPQI